MAAVTAWMTLLTACIGGGGDSASTTVVPTTPPTTVSEVTGATVRLALTPPESLHAHGIVATRGIDIGRLLHTGLTTIGPDGRAEPGLAASWSSDDLITWTFDLVPGATFSDGSPVSAQHFATSWQALADQTTRARSAYLGLVAGIANWADVLGGVEGRSIGVRVVDETTLEVQLARANSWLPELLAHPAFAPVPQSLLTEEAAATGGLTGPVVGTGPFTVDGAPGESGVALVRRPEASDPVPQATFEVSRYEIDYTTTDDEAASAVSRGDADLALVGAASAPPGVIIERHDSNTVLYLGFPTPRGPASTPEPRRMLSLAIDRDSIADRATPDGLDLSKSFAPLSSVNGLSTNCQWCRFSVEEALAIAEAEEIETPENPMSLHVVAGGLADDLADHIASDWSTHLGWPVNVASHPTLRELVGFLQSGVPDGPFIVPWTADHLGAEAFIEPLFDRDGGDDFIRYSNADLTEAFNRLRATPVDDPARVLVVNELDVVLNEVLAFVPLAVVQRGVAHAGAIDLSGVEAGGTRVALDQVRVMP